MLRGVETPIIDIAFFITIDKACKSATLALFNLPLSETNRNEIKLQVHKDKMVFCEAQV